MAKASTIAASTLKLAQYAASLWPAVTTENPAGSYIEVLGPPSHIRT